MREGFLFSLELSFGCIVQTFQLLDKTIFHNKYETKTKLEKERRVERMLERKKELHSRLLVTK